MREEVISFVDAKSRADKYLFKYFPKAPSSFIYKMIRKKNITLNGKKMTGKEILNEGDVIKLFLSDETIDKFSEDKKLILAPYKKLHIVFENEHVLIVDKPCGMLSQKADNSSFSLNEYIITYLISNGSLTKEMLTRFRPSVCNRLDRNTKGLVLAGKTQSGLKMLSGIIKDRSLEKYYLAAVKGRCKEFESLDGYLIKDNDKNIVMITDKEGDDSSYIRTDYSLVQYNEKEDVSLLKIHLITGKSHQIRAHLSSAGHPLLGDVKYGDKSVNLDMSKKYNIKSQMLLAYEVRFPKLTDEYKDISEKSYFASIPESFNRIFGRLDL